MKKLQVKLFNTFDLTLEPVPDEEGQYQLTGPTSDLARQPIYTGLEDQAGVSAVALSYLPPLVTLESLRYNPTVQPAEVALRLSIEMAPLFQPFSQLLQTKTSALDVLTNADIVQPVESP
ncbi:MAG: hypothetical protein AAFV95_24745 [Bacteroidota bacterium]